ncbi:MAG: hypothetical protein HUU10_04690 [Bacteroidetes bacterium]|nr:hypothetical protein [Bacteroidota bacterium]
MNQTTTATTSLFNTGIPVAVSGSVTRPTLLLAGLVILLSGIITLG